MLDKTHLTDRPMEGSVELNRLNIFYSILFYCNKHETVFKDITQSVTV